MERQNVVAHVKFENNDKFYEVIKKAVKLLKGSIVEGPKEKSSE